METENNIQDFEKLVNTVAKEPYCIFKTNLPEKYKIEEKVLQVNSGMTDRDLNKLLCQLLQAEQGLDEDEATYNFEFLLNDDFIKGTLKSHLIKHQIPSEKTLVIHYTFGLEKPKLAKTIQEEDWVWDISKFDGVLSNILIGNNLMCKAEKSFYGVAHFDGSISIFNRDDARMTKAQIAEDASIRALKVVPSKEANAENYYYAITGANDEQIRIALVNATKSKIKVDPVIIGKGHQGSIECVDVDPVNSSFFVSGGADKTLRIWKFEHNKVEKQSGKDAKSTKKVKQQLDEIEPHHASEIHSDEISKVLWARSDTIITGSQDHTIRFFDTVKMKETSILNCKDNAVTSLTHHDNLLISGHEDAYVKVWDEKSSTKQPIKILKAHNKWVSSVKFHPSNPQIFLTGSYDSNVKLWDFRSTFPLINLKDQKEKIFSVEWNGDSHFLTGGSDAKIMSYTFEGQGNK